MEPIAAQDFPDDRFLNREISWTAFNQRVLEEADNTAHPLLERVKFLSISASNLDEFLMVRVAGLLSQVQEIPDKVGHDGRTPSQEVKLVDGRIRALIAGQYESWQRLKHELAENNIHIMEARNLPDARHDAITERLTGELAGSFRTMIVTENTRFPLMVNLEMAMVCLMENPQEENPPTLGVVRLPPTLERLLPLPEDNAEESTLRMVWLEDALKVALPHFFPDTTIISSGVIRLVRDSELEISEDEGDDLTHSFESALALRDHGALVCLQHQAGIAQPLLSAVAQAIELPDDALILPEARPGLDALMNLYEINRPALKFTPQQIRFPERINDYGGDYFAAISAKDIVVHHPYESFDVVVQLLHQAAKDPYVTHISQTLYRTSRESPIVDALTAAAKAGKEVCVVVEVKARFDEEANLQWGRGLERAGARVYYGKPKLKTHAKVSLITRRVGDERQQYVHFGTGNYHPLTARVYSDLSYFTCNPALCDDAQELFDYLNGEVAIPTFRKLAVAPLYLRNTILGLIEDEIVHARAGRPAAIWLKMNSLVDAELIDALYEASQDGVSIDLIVRGVCCLKPGVKNLSENIRVKSIVGRFLEHARIFCFGGGYPLPSSECKVYISSADWMPRNMDRRVELLIPIENDTVHEQILMQIMASNLRDEKQSWRMKGDGSYERVPFVPSSFSAHAFFMANPSLSGRGSAARPQVSNNTPSSPLPPVKPRNKRHIAVIDVGSNSVRLVIYDGLTRVPLPVFNEKVLCGLARGMAVSNRLHPDGRVEAMENLRRYARIIQNMEIETIFAVATAAVRDAEDGPAFVKEVREETGLFLTVLPGTEEARLAAMGIAAAFYEVDGVVCDLGGGSMDFARVVFKREMDPERHNMFADSNVVSHCQSFPIGPLRIEGNDVPEYELDDWIDAQLTPYPFEQTLKGKTLYAVGGGFRALAKLHQKIYRYKPRIIQHYMVSPASLLSILQDVIRMGPKKLQTIAEISDERAAVLGVTARLMARLIALSQPARIVFSTHGVREGILFDKLPVETKAQDGLIKGCADMIHYISPHTNTDWQDFSESLYRWIVPLFPFETERMERTRRVCCLLSWIGWYEHRAYRAEMAMRWVLDSELTSINHPERMFVAMAVYHHHRSAMDNTLVKRAKTLLSTSKFQQARMMGAATRLGYVLSGGAPEILERCRLSIENTRQLVLHLPGGDAALAASQVVKRLARLAKLMKLKPVIR